MHLSSDDSDLKVTEVMFQTAMRSYHTTSEEHLYQLICMNQWIPTRGLCTELNIDFSALETVVTMSEYHSLCQDGPMNADAGTERTPYANLLGPIEPMQG